MHEKFIFDVNICDKCENKSSFPIHLKYDDIMLYCFCCNDFITRKEGYLCDTNTRLDLNLKDIKENYDPRVKKCPYYLEHMIKADEKRKP